MKIYGREKHPKSIDLTLTMKERGAKIVERFREVAEYGVVHPKLLLALEDVKGYWKDPFRPALTSFCCEAVGGQPEIADAAGLMFTLAAAGTGIHDDIIDKQSRKRFRMTILGEHGHDVALLVGDLLIVKAWSSIQEIIRKTNHPEKIANLIETYGFLSIKICEAELMETLCRQKLDTSLEDYKKILETVNADLEACARVGAILGDGSEVEIETLSQVGRHLGFMLGLRDDTISSLNLEGTLPHRLIYESIPLPLLFASHYSEENNARIRLILEKKPISSPDIAKLLEICFESGAFFYVRDIAKQNAREATRKLLTLEQTFARDVLGLIIKNSFKTIEKYCV